MTPAAAPVKEIKRLNDLGVGKGKVDGPKLDPLDIQVRPGFQMRDMTTPRVREHIEFLKASIRENGVEKPLQVEWSDRVAYLIDGHCRWTAACELRKEGLEIWVPVNQVTGDEATILATALRANGGLPPTELEFGESAKKLVAYGWSVEKIAELAPPHLATAKMRKMWTRQAIELQNAPIEVKEQVKKGVDGVTVSAAAALSETRKSRTNAAENIRTKAAAAKAAGKKSVKREKTDGKATQAKKQATTALEVGDDLAALCISEHSDWDEIMKTAKKYLRLRK